MFATKSWDLFAFNFPLRTKRKISEVASTDASPTNHGDESKSTQSIELSGEPPQTRMKTKAELEFERIQDKKVRLNFTI